jgi:hypothetical protein
MPDNEEMSSLEQVRKRLYDPNPAPASATPELNERPVEQSRGWEHLKTVRKEAEHIAGPARFFIVALVFFVITAAGAAFYLIYGGNAVSSNNVNVAIQGPTTIASGDTVPLLITIENRNPVAIQAASISIDFPQGTKSADDPTVDLSHYTENLGDIASGGKVERTVRAVVYGSEGQHVALPLKITYRTAKSTSVFVKNKQYDFTITSSPISLTVKTLSQVSAGQPVSVDVTVRSNASTPIDNVGVLAEYPFGFQPTSATPQPTSPSGTLFNLGTLQPGEEKHIVVQGVVSGENNDDRIFKFTGGTLGSATASSLATPYTTQTAAIKLTKPFLSTTLQVNQDTSTAPVVDAGAPVQVTITWVNTLPTPITNARIAVRLSGSGFDPASVIGGNGFYRSVDSTVLYDSSTNPALAMLQPGDTGQGRFTFRSKSAAALGSLRDPSITMQVSVAGQRLSETNVPETLTSTLSRNVKVGTNLTLDSRIVHTTGPFANSGPWPPTANSETTYTVMYTLSNTGNTVAGSSVTAALPSYVRYTGATSVADGSVTYNDTTRTVTWTAGDVTSGGSKTVAFQIGFTPSTEQRDTSPTLLFAQQVTGVDRFTQRQISGSTPALTTQLRGDPGYSPIDGNVK